MIPPRCIGHRLLLAAPHMKANPRHRYIFDILLREKRFIAFDTRADDYVEEMQNKGLAATFFEAMQGRTIKGLRTRNQVLYCE